MCLLVQRCIQPFMTDGPSVETIHREVTLLPPSHTLGRVSMYPHMLAHAHPKDSLHPCMCSNNIPQNNLASCEDPNPACRHPTVQLQCFAHQEQSHSCCCMPPRSSAFVYLCTSHPTHHSLLALPSSAAYLHHSWAAVPFAVVNGSCASVPGWGAECTGSCQQGHLPLLCTAQHQGRAAQGYPCH